MQRRAIGRAWGVIIGSKRAFIAESLPKTISAFTPSAKRKESTRLCPSGLLAGLEACVRVLPTSALKLRWQNFPGNEYDLICTFDSPHDMGDPVGGAAHIRQALKPDGTFMMVEPFAGDKLEENFHPRDALPMQRPPWSACPRPWRKRLGWRWGWAVSRPYLCRERI